MPFAKVQLHEKSDEGYLYEEPDTLPEYQRDFAAPLTVIEPGSDVLGCPGCGYGARCFLAAEGLSSCGVCKAVLCRHCVADLKATPHQMLCMRLVWGFHIHFIYYRIH